MPYAPKPLRADLRDLYLENASRHLHDELVRGGEEDMRLLLTSWPDLARDLEVWDRMYAMPVVDEPFPAQNGSSTPW